MIKNEDNSVENVTEIGQLLRDEGLEIVSFGQRFIQAEEAFFLRNRIVS